MPKVEKEGDARLSPLNQVMLRISEGRLLLVQQHNNELRKENKELSETVEELRQKVEKFEDMASLEDKEVERYELQVTDLKKRIAELEAVLFALPLPSEESSQRAQAAADPAHTPITPVKWKM